MTDKKLDEILAELFRLDPALIPEEKSLRQILARILASKPQVVIDQAFRKRLKDELLAFQAAEKKERKASLWSFFSVKKLGLAATGLVVAALIIIPLYSYFTNEKKESTTKSSQYKINKVSDQAFGQLSAPAKDSTASPETATGRGGQDQSLIEPGKDLPPDYAGFKYVYTGTLSLAGLDNQVLKRTMDFSDSSLFKNYLPQVEMGLLDLASFTNLAVNNITLRQSGDQAYEINLNLSRGTISLAQAWQTWYGDVTVMKAEIENLGPSDLLPESELKSIADKFIQDHGINITGYGPAELLPTYQAYYVKAPEYLPESLTLVYPLLINSKSVYNTNGEKAGIQVNVDQRLKKVASLSFLAVQKFQASAYPLETDPAKILKLVEQGGIYPTVFGEGNVTEYQLGAPEQGYLLLEKENEDLFVPSLVFPVQNNEAYQQNIVVPVVSGLVEDLIGNIMPVDTGTGSSEPGSAGTEPSGAGTEPLIVNESIVLPD